MINAEDRNARFVEELADVHVAFPRPIVVRQTAQRRHILNTPYLREKTSNFSEYSLLVQTHNFYVLPASRIYCLNVERNLKLFKLNLNTTIYS